MSSLQPTPRASQYNFAQIEEALGRALSGVVTQFVSFPAASDTPGQPGHISHGTVGGVSYLALYTGDGTNHTWVFLSASGSRPTE